MRFDFDERSLTSEERSYIDKRMKTDTAFKELYCLTKKTMSDLKKIDEQREVLESRKVQYLKTYQTNLSKLDTQEAHIKTKTQELKNIFIKVYEIDIDALGVLLKL